jgi:hypothetical protein
MHYSSSAMLGQYRLRNALTLLQQKLKFKTTITKAHLGYQTSMNLINHIPISKLNLAFMT